MTSICGHPVLSHCTGSKSHQDTLYLLFLRTKPKLLLETDPFSRVNNYKVLLQVNRSLLVHYKDPIARDFTLSLESGRQVSLHVTSLSGLFGF